MNHQPFSFSKRIVFDWIQVAYWMTFLIFRMGIYTIVSVQILFILYSQYQIGCNIDHFWSLSILIWVMYANLEHINT